MHMASPLPVPGHTGLRPHRSARLDKRIVSGLAGNIMRWLPARWELGHRGTHGVLTRQAMTILLADGHRQMTTWLRNHERVLIRGLYWADEGWKCVTHFYHPTSGQGYLGWPNAVTMMNEYAQLATYWYNQGVPAAAAFYLGAAIHLVQDLCVPHHASITVGHGHRSFEAAGEQQVCRYLVRANGVYEPWTPAQWLHANAAAARPWLHEPAGKDCGLGAMLERSQRTTAGFLYAFFSTTQPR